MRKIKHPKLDELLTQLRFMPRKHRDKHLDAAEKLLDLIEPEKQYPWDFVCYRITGFHPKRTAEDSLIKGSELADDLRAFISRLSTRLAKPITQQKGKIYTIDELAEKFGVSTKTIHRWRRAGLPARKFIFEDGIKRLGFRRSAVERFVAKNPNLVTRAKGFARLSDSQKRRIIKRAYALASRSSLTRYQVVTRIAQETGRARETIRYILLNHEQNHPDRPIFKRRPGVISPAQAAEIYRLYKQGCPIAELMERFDRSKSSIYRLINQRRARAILARRIEYVPSQEFLEDNAREKILGKPLNFQTNGLQSTDGLLQLPGESLLPQYLQRLKQAPVLDRQTEVELFRRYNYLKYLASVRRAGLSPAPTTSARLTEIETYLAEADRTKEIIIEANLRVVVAVALKHASAALALSDLIGEGNISLMQAVETFDYTRGIRFSTHASWAIARDYARKVPPRSVRTGKAADALLSELHRDFRIDTAADVLMVEHARRDLWDVIQEELDERQRYVIVNHFGLSRRPVKKKKKTLKQIGRELGLTKERVRQVELEALQKLRRCLTVEQFELLTR